jgi:hypothetical protein
MGRDAAQMQHNMALIKDLALIKELADSCPSVTVVVGANGYRKDDPAS